MNPRELAYLRLISGEARGPSASLARWALWGLSLPYGVAVRGRNFCYSCGLRRVHRVDVPVVCIGNLTVGGTGKTPAVEWVARFYRQRELGVAILSRGYGAENGRNDEARVLEENLPDVPHLQGADRVEIAQRAIEELESELLLLDDGFQHRRLARDLDVVLVDATRPWGYGHLLPRGLLREPRSALRRAGVVLLTRVDSVSADTLASLRCELARLAPRVPVVESVHRPLACVHSPPDQEADLAQLLGRPVAAFCGLGNPLGFRRTLERLGVHLLALREYPDHYDYNREAVDDLQAWAKEFPAETVIATTQKDLVKLRVNELAGRPVWALRVGLEITAGQDLLETALLRAARQLG